MTKNHFLSRFPLLRAEYSHVKLRTNVDLQPHQHQHQREAQDLIAALWNPANQTTVPYPFDPLPG